MAHRILIVDDSATIRGLIRRSISLAGVDVQNFYEAGDGLEALAQLKEHEVDLILADRYWNPRPLTRPAVEDLVRAMYEGSPDAVPG